MEKIEQVHVTSGGDDLLVSALDEHGDQILLATGGDDAVGVVVDPATLLDALLQVSPAFGTEIARTVRGMLREILAA